MTGLAILLLIVILSYLLGAIPFGYLIARMRGVDIFSHGSGNIGATNVGRVLGKPYGILVFVLDFAKGATPVAAAAWVAAGQDFALPKDTLPVVAGLAAFLGHLFPIYLRFRGGKGVATGAGVVAVLLPGPAVGALLVWALVICLTRYVSLASLCAAATLCALRILMTANAFSADALMLTLFCVVAAGLVWVRHYANIRRLLKGTENRLKDSPGMFQLMKTIHVLAIGLWFGSVVFFSFAVAPVVFSSLSALTSSAPDERPVWLPVNFSQEQATQLAGIVVGPIFNWYFPLQGVSGLFAVATALRWSRAEPQTRVHNIRFFVLAAALAAVLTNWLLAQKVEELRMARYAVDTAIAQAARQSFGAWHTMSLLLNFITMMLVMVAMGLAATLPRGGTTNGD
jgi:acyl-phosphate glycerol 3-phosphate acyltransferase